MTTNARHDDERVAAEVQPARATDLDLHLRVIGGLLEEHKLFQRPRLDAVKNLALRVFRDLAPEPLDLRRIKEVLCFDDVPLVNEDVLRQALNELQRKDGKLKAVSKSPKHYVLVGELAPAADSIRQPMSDCWTRHFKTCRGATFELFQRCVVLLFAKYGCSAYDALTSRPGTAVRLDEVVRELGLAEPLQRDFLDCFGEFVISSAPADAELKVRLASAYSLLRMNGAGNWGRDELTEFFAKRKFLLDTNILFELMSRSVGQVTKMFRHLEALGASFAVGAETLKEFETALRNGAEQVLEIIGRGVDLLRLVDGHVVRSDWVRALCVDYRTPSRKQVLERVEQLLVQVEGMLEAAGVERVNLERSPPSSQREARVKRVQELALETRRYEKREEVALHDALVWEAIEEEPRLADMVLTLDRSLGRVRIGDRRLSIMLDEVVAYALMGGMGQAELAELFSHALTQDLYPDAPFLQMTEVLGIAGMEARLLAVPARVLRSAASELSTVRARRARAGEVVSDDECGRVLMTTIAAYDEDSRVAQREHDIAVAERTRADREAAARRVAEDQAKADQERIARMEREQAEQRRSTDLRFDSLQSSFHEITVEKSTLRADLDATRRVQEEERKESEERKGALKRQRDWMLFSGAWAVLGATLFTCGITWAGLLAAALAGGCLFWAALAQETPSVSIPVLTLALGVIVAGAGIAEKWPPARQLLRLAAPAPAPSPGSSSRSP